MNKTILSIITSFSLFFITKSSAQSTAINDSAFEQRLLDLGVDSGSLDGYILNLDAEAVNGTLDLSYVDAGFGSGGSGGSGGSPAGLVDLTGIDAFINITGLKITKDSPFGANDAIATMDLSKNLKLTSVELSNSTAISSFDFSKNTKLENLKITSDFTSISTLNLTGLISLTELRLQNITLSSLNLNAYPNLEILDIYISSNLSTLNFSGLTSLSNLRLERMGSAFTTIDLTVPSASLSHLDLINNPNLATVTLSNFSFLSNVNIKQNPLLTTTLDFSTAGALVNLDLSNNDLSSVNLKSGGNDILVNLDLRTNTNLNCVKVDSPFNSYKKNSWFKDAQTYYVKENCDRVAISDVEFEERLISKGIDTTAELDGYILKEDAEAVTGTLNMTENGRTHQALTSYSGIESFVNITGFIADSENDVLASLDLSKNTKLTSIDIKGITNFSVFDFTANTNMQTLKIGSLRAPITNLNINGLTQLRNLEILNTSLNTLDVSSFTNLTRLTLKEAYEILTLNVSNNPLIDFINVNDCNKLKSVNTAPGTYAMEYVNVTNNNNLICVQVDSVSFANGNNWPKDAHTTYSNTACEFVSIEEELEKRLISAGIDKSGIEDGFILKTNAEAVTGILDISTQISAPLTSYDGIESFVNITGFIASNATDIINSLDLSNNLLLKTIDIQGVTNFTDFDFTANTNLEVLKINGTRTVINSLNINGLNALKVVEIYNSSFANLNLDTLTNLTTLKLNASNNLLAINVSNTPVLEELIINNCNSLTTLNVANGTNNLMASFNITNNAILECVQVDDITYSEANWSNKDAQTYYTTKACDFVSIPDAQFEQRLINLGIDTTGILDKKIFRDDAEAVTDLNISDYQELTGVVTDLTGIEAFINITKFSSEYPKDDTYNVLDLCNSPLLEEVYLTQLVIENLDFSKNTNLIKIDFNQFYKTIKTLNINGLTKLERAYIAKLDLNILDLSTNVALKNLDISNSNITTIDLSKNINLEYFRFNNVDRLSHIDFTKNVKLNDLKFSYCDDLQSINLANGANNLILGDKFQTPMSNPQLVCIQVDDVAYANENWTVKESHNIYTNQSCDFVSIPDAEFEKRLINLGIAKSSVVDGVILKYEAETTTSLNISTEAEVNGSITDLTGLETFVNITTFKAINANDKITSLDLSKNTLLEELNIQNIMDFSNYDLSSNTNLKKIQIKNGYQPIASLNISNSAPLNSLEIKNTSLTDLNIATYTGITNFRVEDASNLLELDVSSNTNIKKLFVVNCDALTSLNTSNLSSLQIIDVMDSSNILRLDLSSNNVLSRVSVTNNTSLKNINATNIGIAVTEFFNITSNPSLLCVQVDNVAYSNENWTLKEDHTSYNTDCELNILKTDAIQLSKVTVYPNPVHEKFSINGIEEIISIEIINEIGQRVFYSNKPMETVYVNYLKPGSYFLRITNTIGVVVKKIIKM